MLLTQLFHIVLPKFFRSTALARQNISRITAGRGEEKMTKLNISILPLLLAVVTAAGCGKNGSPTKPTDPTPTPTPTPSGMTFAVLDQESGITVPSGTVTVNGMTTNIVNGLVTVNGFAGADATIAVPGHITRMTRLGDPEIRVMANIDESTMRAMLYGSWTSGRIKRPTSPCVLVPEGEVASDQSARNAVEQTANIMTNATGGNIPFSMSDNASGGCVIRIRVNGVMPAGAAAVFFLGTHSGDVFAGGVIEVRSIWGARSAVLLAHECGHAFGLDHNPGFGLMNAHEITITDFTPEEKRVMMFSASRRPGTKPLDDDR
jgi:hypothetical protein